MTPFTMTFRTTLLSIKTLSKMVLRIKTYNILTQTIIPLFVTTFIFMTIIAY
jgi:hypothetical protein